MTDKEDAQQSMFGDDAPASVDRFPRGKSGALTSNPMLVIYGRGPMATTCQRCVHLKGSASGRFYKCDLRRNSASTATDHRVRWPACGKYEEETR